MMRSPLREMGVVKRDIGVAFPRWCGEWVASPFFQKSRVRVLRVKSGESITEVMPFTNPATHSMGGKAVAAKLTPEQLSAKLRRVVQMRWARVKREKKAA